MSAPPKFVFECLEETCPNRKCCNRAPVMIYFEDIKRWATDQALNIVFANLEFTSEKGYSIILKKYPNETLCAMFNKETKKCNIYYSKPISCSAYPLGFNGNAFFVVDKECQGLLKGDMTKDTLKEMRDRAKLEFECRTLTLTSLPILQILFMQYFHKQSEEAMKSLSEEDKKKLEEILGERGRSAEEAESTVEKSATEAESKEGESATKKESE